jgi:hypothetical protein
MNAVNLLCSVGVSESIKNFQGNKMNDVVCVPLGYCVWVAFFICRQLNAIHLLTVFFPGNLVCTISDEF